MLILASGSPRRRELLSLFTENFAVIPSDCDEAKFTGGDVAAYVMSLAEAKARDVAQKNPGACVIGADTVVALSGRVLGKPSGEEEAKAMLSALSGKTHSVFTGVCVVCGERCELFAEETRVTFFSLSKDEISAYVATGDPLDKAGAYGIQSGANVFVSRLSGDYFNVIGLPMKRLCETLRSFSE